MADSCHVSPETLPSIYEGWISSAIDEEGISLPQAMRLDQNGELTIYALALPVDEAYPLMLTEWLSKKPQAMIFAFDRFAKDGQGTTLGDLMAGHYFVGGERRPFIVEYQHKPRIVKPINWSNDFWNAALMRELAANVRNLTRGAVAH